MLFNLVVKHSPVFFWAEKLSVAVFIVHASIFSPRFSQKQSAKQPKKYRGMFFYLKLLKSTCKNSGTFEGKKIHPKKSCTKPFKYNSAHKCVIIEGFRGKRAYIAFLADFHFLQDQANFWQTDLF